MKIRNKKTGSIGFTGKFNTHTLAEIIVYFEDDDCSSEYIKDYDVYLESVCLWIDMGEAFERKLIIPDNYNTEFREPLNVEEKERGYY